MSARDWRGDDSRAYSRDVGRDGVTGDDSDRRHDPLRRFWLRDAMHELAADAARSAARKAQAARARAQDARATSRSLADDAQALQAQGAQARRRAGEVLDRQAEAGAGARVLVVDDHESVRVILRELMERLPGFTVVAEAATGVDAIAAADALRADLVLMDVRMPGMDGIEATRRIVERHPHARVWLVSSQDPEVLRDLGEACGAAGILDKRRLTSRLIGELWAAADGNGVDPGVAHAISLTGRPESAPPAPAPASPRMSAT